MKRTEFLPALEEFAERAGWAVTGIDTQLHPNFTVTFVTTDNEYYQREQGKLEASTKKLWQSYMGQRQLIDESFGAWLKKQEPLE